MQVEQEYLAHRSLVVRLAYDITGSWADAEDVAQQTWLRWQSVDTEVENPRAYLARIASRLALDVVAARERMGYPGPFLPEPVPTGPGADAAVEQAQEVEVALMVVLGTLSPLERAAFLLHDVFGFSHAEVADMLGRQEAAVRQLASRARRRIRERPDAVASDLDVAELRDLSDRFLGAARNGDLAALQEFLTEDVVFVGDGGGVASTTRRPVHGVDPVARLLVGLMTKYGSRMELEVVQANHRPALAMYLGGELDTLTWLIVREGRIARVLVVRNPHKLGLWGAAAGG